MPTDLPPPGPERDAEIARLILTEWPADRCRVCGWALAGSPDIGCTPESCSLRPPPSRRADDPPPYSTDPATADQLVEEMERRGWGVWITYRSWLGESTKHQARISRGGLVPIYANGTTRPDAVSAAALLALRGAQ